MAIYAFIGTKAQYLKTVPVLFELDRLSIPYRIIDSGQHAEFSARLREEMGLPEPAASLGGGRDIATIPQAIKWAMSLAALAASRRRVERLFPEPGLCLVHGDTPSTLLAAILARRAGVEIAHLESGLRSHSILNPFPEELIRVIVMRMADVLFAPSEEAERNLRMMKVRGEVVKLSGNTTIDSMAQQLDGSPGNGSVVATLHRVENLHRKSRLLGFLEVVREAASHHPVHMVLHPPTVQALTKLGLMESLSHPNIVTSPLLPHDDFLDALWAAPFVITDGGSIQEECAQWGIPTLLWRSHTEREDGLHENVVLSDYSISLAREFVRGGYKAYRRAPKLHAVSPSREIAEYIRDNRALWDPLARSAVQR